MFSPGFKIDSSQSAYAKDLRSAIDQIGVVRTVGKGELMMDTVSPVEHFFFVKQGIFKTWKWIDEREFIVGFTFAGDVDGDPSASLNNTLSEFSIEAVTPGEVIVCKWGDLELFLQREKYLLTIKYFLIQYVSVLQNRLIESIALTAEERYKNLIRQNAQFLDQIPMTDLACYLGITKQSLSRIRSAKF